MITKLLSQSAKELKISKLVLTPEDASSMIAKTLLLQPLLLLALLLLLQLQLPVLSAQPINSASNSMEITPQELASTSMIHQSQ
jgi:hypothetical protein